MPFHELLAAVRWWLVLLVIGAAATPLSLFLFRRLSDRGYAFTKMVGLLIVSYLFWLMGSFGLLGNSVGGLLFALACLIALSYWAYRANGSEIRQWLLENKSQVVITEALFLLVFALWVWVRSQNPAIAATEKPMEFGFLNAIGRSPSFPPLDPWMSGFAISYYYFGYVMTSAIARLALVSEPVAFNLGIAWLVAGSAVGAFGLVYNLVGSRSGRQRAVILGLVAAAALPIAGNLEIGLELLHANGKGSPGFWQWLDVRDLNGPAQEGGTPRYETTNWWWWRASRVIHEYHLSGRAEEGLEPIAEFPGFSFVLGDMHPHVLALPFAFLSLALAFSWWLREAENGETSAAAGWDNLDWPSRARRLVGEAGVPRWVFTVIVLGGLSFLNTWDVLIHAFVVLAAFFLGRWRRSGWHSRIISQTLLLGILLVVPAILAYLPFYLGFRSQAGPPYLLPMLMRPTRLAQFLIIFGMPLWSIGLLLIVLGVKQRFRYWRSGLRVAIVVVGGLLLLMLFLGWVVASSADGAGRVIALADELGLSLPGRSESAMALGWGISALVTLAPAVLRARLASPWLTLLLAGVIALATMAWLQMARKQGAKAAVKSGVEAGDEAPGSLPFVLLLIATGALLTIGPEFVYLRDNFGVRLNTVFKFYYQAWVMLGAAALFGLHYLWQQLEEGINRLTPLLATAGYATMLVVSLLFPVYAISSRMAEYRGAAADARQPATLDGLAQMSRYNPDDYSAVLWLRENVEGTPVILEAVGGQYSEFARISASTGLPTILGWPGHELQWRGSANPEPGLRDPVVRRIYTELRWENIEALLDAYQVEYVFVGNLERSAYGAGIDEKLSAHMAVAYSNNSVVIYQRRPQ